MKFIQVKTYEELSRKAADIIGSLVILKPNCVLGLATGSSPVGTYKELIADYNKGTLDFSGVTTVNLDEYVNLDVNNDQSYRYFMNHNLFDHINIDKSRTFVPNGCAADLELEGAAYDNRIKELGGIDLQLLGIGLDGHIGFNEPDSHFIKETHVVTLHESTIEANARFFESIDMVPREAITMGIGPIMQAKRVVLVASGENKRDIIQKTVFGPITPEIPASILQLHPNATIIFSEN